MPLFMWSAHEAGAANMQPISLSGYNRDMVVERTASGPPYGSVVATFNPGEGTVFYENGLPNTSYGLPTSRTFTSVADNATVFQFQPYTANNALVLSSDTGLSTGTLVLTPPGIYNRIAILANSAGGGGNPSLTLNFSDGSTITTTYNAVDWFEGNGYALTGVERINLSNGSLSGAPGNPRFYQTTIDLSGTTKILNSITFNKASGAGATAIWAVSGESSIQFAPTLTSQPTNLTVSEMTSATFSATAIGNPAPGFQWYKNGGAISGATNASYTIPGATMTDNGALFRMVASNVVSNITCSVTSSAAMLTVIADTNPPVLLGAQSLGLSKVAAYFSERIAYSTATNLANYAIAGTNGNLSITNASLDASQSNVVLSVVGMVDGAAYTLTVNSLTDLSAAHNVIAPQSLATFIASVYVPISIGGAAGGQTVVSGGGLNLTGGGAGIGGTFDQSQLAYILQNGDFDYKVRLDSLGLADAWSQAGMMVREDLSSGARFASVLATPSISGAFFESRSQTNGGTVSSGSFPVNYPNTWLRIKRTGNTFSGFAGFDGQNWTQLGVVNLVFPSTVYFSFVASSHNTNQVSTACFRDFATVTNAGTNAPLTREPLGQSSRRTSLVISEIMYHPVNSNLEFVEIFNTRGEPQDMSGYQLAGSIRYQFPANTVIPGGGFLVVANSPVDLQNAYGISGVLGPYEGNLPNDAGSIQLLNQAGGVFLEVDYSDSQPWPVAADGAGHSLVLAHASYGENNPLAWEASDSAGGSPGKIDPITLDPLRNVLINEVLAHSDSQSQFVELYNRSNQALDVSGCSLSDGPQSAKFIIPAGTSISAHGYLSYNQTQLGFTLDPSGDTVYFRSADGQRALDLLRLEAQQSNVSFGRAPDGSDNWRQMAAATPGATNSKAVFAPIVINEIMYDPITLNDDDQYVELYNRGSNAVNMGGWRFTSGITFTFPTNAILQPGGYFVVARNAPRLLTNYPSLNSGNLAGSFSGSLSHKGERVALSLMDFLVDTNSKGKLVTNTIYPVENEVTYGSGGRWGQWSHGDGSSLELLDPRADNTLAPNWADSDETKKAPWTIISANGTLDNGTFGSSADELQILLQGAGECLVDEVQVLSSSNVNLIANSSFESGANGWTAEGTESLSSLETSEGFNSANSFHIRAVDRGDDEVNRVRAALTNSLPSGTTNVTIRAKVRWLKGHPEVLLRLRGNWLECIGEMNLPANLGTPGARNSRCISNAPPAITQVAHSPVLPQANEPVVVSAALNDPDGVSSTVLKYRLDPNLSYTSVSMNDSGTNGDAVAGDGIYSATIPGQAAGTMVAFYVQASDGSVVSSTATFPNDAPVRECLVRFGEVQPVGNFPVYRVWMTQATLNKWNSRNRMDNTPNDVTFVLGNQRAIYNSQALYAGSPYIAPGYSSPLNGCCGYSITVPADDLFLGEQDLAIDWPGGHGGETSAMQEQMGYWIAERLNLPFCHRYTIRFHINGVTDESRHATFEAFMQPAGGFLKEWSPGDANGQLFKVERAFDCDDSGGLAADVQPRLENYTTTGGIKKLARYRWNWMPRGADYMNDLTNIFTLVDAVNAVKPQPYTDATLGLVDINEWMRIFAVEHIIVNFDSYGHAIGKNMYAYKPASGKWQLYMVDLDWLMLAAQVNNSSYTANNAPLFVCEDPTISAMYAFPPFARCYWRAILDAINGPFDPATCNSLMDAKYQSLLANGVAWCDGQSLTDPGVVKLWFSQRRAFMQSQLATVASPFTVNSQLVVTNAAALISGTAPIDAETIWINGVEYPITWTSVTSWTAKVPLRSGTNLLNVVAVDAKGQPLSGLTTNVQAVYNGTVTSPTGQVVINEIMINPLMPNAQYLELYNNSSNTVFDLSGWQVQGLGYTFPAGSLIGPTNFLVLSANRAAFAAAYGATIPVFDTFSASFLPNQSLSLVMPNGNGTNDLIVARVEYESKLPWPTNISGTGNSLQLIDSRQDNWRCGNWLAGAPTPGTGNIGRTTLPTFATLWINEVQADNLTGITNGAGQRTGWLELYNPGTNAIVMTNLFLANTYTNLTRWSFATGAVINPGQFKVVFADVLTNLTTSNEWHTSFALPSGAGSIALSRLYNGQPQVLDYLSYTNLVVNHSYGSLPDGQSFDRREFYSVTPGGTNNGSFPLTLRINEWMAANTKTLQDPLDSNKYDDWFEIYNYGSNAVSLEGFYMTNTLDVNFSIMIPVPAGYTIPPKGILLVWADKKTPTGSGDFHANFKLNKAGSTIALFDPNKNLMDYVTFGAQTPDISMGLYPDGSTNIVYMVMPTPRTLNIYNTSPLLPPINDMVMTVGQTLDFDVLATDADFPPQTLTYSLEPGAPAGAVIDPVSGHFNWVVSGPPGTNFITIKVTDNGFPAASDSKTFSVKVFSPPQFSAIQHNDTDKQIILTWTAHAGQNYQLEYKNDLSEAVWTPVGAPLAGVDGVLAITNTLSGVSQQFFRLRMVP